MASKQTITVSVVADTRPLQKGFASIGDKLGLSRLSSGIAAVGKAVAGLGVAAGAAGVALAGKTVQMASELEQSTGAVEQVFKSSSDTMTRFAQNAANSVGLARNEYQNLAVVLGSQLKNGGTSIDELADKTSSLISVGADLASMFGGTTADAVGALSSALKGERDPIERYGISLNQAAVDAKAAELGFKKVGGSLDSTASQAATLALIMEQSKDAQGNFVRESDTLAQKQQKLQAKLADAGAAIGTLFLPAVSAAAGWIVDRFTPAAQTLAAFLETKVVPAVTRLAAQLSTQLGPVVAQVGTWLSGTLVPAISALGGFIVSVVVPGLSGLVGWLVSARGILIPLATVILTMVAAWKAWTIAQSAWAVATGIATAAQSALNVALDANPIGAIILLVMGLIAGIVALYQNNETARKIITGAWDAIKTAVGAVIGFITDTLVPGLVGAWNWLVGVATTVASAISNAFKNFGNAVSTVVSNVIAWFRALPGRILGFVSGIGTRITSFFASIPGSIGGIVDRVVGFFRSLPGNIVSALASIGGTMARIGEDMISGLVNALNPGRVIDKIKSIIGDALGWAKRLLGINSPSKVFAKIGEFTVQGFALGIDQQTDTATRAMGRLGGAVISAAPRTIPAPRVATSASAPGITINVTAPVGSSPVDIGRDLARYLRSYIGRGGSL